MKNKFIKIATAITMVIALLTPTAVSASSWYGSHITLPRAGETWWATRVRRGTSNTQGLKASQNAHEVVGNIANTGNQTLGGWCTFPAHNRSAQYITTYGKGMSMKAVFQTNRYNLLTTTAYLEWRP